MRVTTDLDTEIGLRLRQARHAKGLTQSDLAQLIKISFQQIQKYENGSNRISATRLLHISKSLGVPVTYFYDDLGEPDLTVRTPSLPDRVMRSARILDDIPDGDVKDQIFMLLKALGKDVSHEYIR